MRCSGWYTKQCQAQATHDVLTETKYGYVIGSVCREHEKAGKKLGWVLRAKKAKPAQEAKNG